MFQNDITYEALYIPPSRVTPSLHDLLVGPPAGNAPALPLGLVYHYGARRSLLVSDHMTRPSLTRPTSSTHALGGTGFPAPTSGCGSTDRFVHGGEIRPTNCVSESVANPISSPRPHVVSFVVTLVL